MLPEAEQTCGRCAGRLVAGTAFRRRRLLVGVGFVLLAAGVYLAGCGVLMLLAAPLASPDEVMARSVARVRQEAVRKLQALDGVPPRAIAEFERTGHIGEQLVQAMPESTRPRVRGIIAGTHARNVLVAPAAGLGTVFLHVMLALYLVCGGLALLFGWLLLRRRVVMRCLDCRAVFAPGAGQAALASPADR